MHCSLDPNSVAELSRKTAIFVDYTVNNQKEIRQINIFKQSVIKNYFFLQH